MGTSRRRLDAELVRRGLVASRVEARAAIDAGRITVDGAPAWKPATLVDPAQAVVVSGPPRRYASRGGDKLEAALDRFGVDPAGRRCLDVGASTGGFTDCLLQRGAAHVVAVDVGYGQLHQRLRRDDRVTVLERTNARDLTRDDVPAPPPDLVVADVSFISLTLVLPALRALASDGAEAVVLVKPQFEAGRDQVGKGGVVRDADVWARTIRRVARAATALGWAPAGVAPSPLTGPAGNVEFLLHLVPDPGAADGLEERIDAAVREATAR
ncbi:MAG: TlyA family RNA methyltransferase [Actinomycetota bacterium]|nr:TlyA family RNA methyltransferase [Actinomycetota bacterium]